MFVLFVKAVFVEGFSLSPEIYKRACISQLTSVLHTFIKSDLNDDKLSLIMCSLCSMSISEQSGPKKDQGELAYLHVFILNLTAEPPWCFLNRDTLCFYSYSHFYVYNDFLVIMPVLQLVWRGFFKIIFVEECSQLHPFKCLFLQSKHAPSRHRPSSSLCQV